MAILSGNVIGNMKGKLGNLSARTVDGRTIMAARPSSFNASQDPASLEVRAKFAVTANFAKNVLSLATLEEIWTKVKASGMSVFNTVFKNNFGFLRLINQPNRIFLHRRDFLCRFQLLQ